MTPAEFAAWLDAMKASGHISRKAWQRDAAELLGVDTSTLRVWAADGAPRLVALACKALLA